VLGERIHDVGAWIRKLLEGVSSVQMEKERLSGRGSLREKEKRPLYWEGAFHLNPKDGRSLSNQIREEEITLLLTEKKYL